MLIKSYILAFCILHIFASASLAQSLKVISDPSGNEIIIDEDSSFIYRGKDHLMMFALDPKTDMRNVLVFNGDTSFWLFNTGFNKALTFSNFTDSERYGIISDEVWFRVGSIWYQTTGTPASTIIFNDNADINNPYQIIRAFQLFNFNFSFEAIEKTTGDTLVVFYDEDTKIYRQFRDAAGYPVKIVHESEEFAISGSETIDFIGAKYNPDQQTWGPIGVYQATLHSLTSLHELGPRTKYELNFVYKDYLFYQYIIDHSSSDSTNVLEYSTVSDTFENVSMSVLPGYEVLDAYNLQTVYQDGENSGMNSHNESIWKCKNVASGVVRYYLRSTFRADKEIVDLRNDENAFFMFDEGTEDTLYYYNYGEAQKGLIHYSTLNNTTKKDPTSIPFDQDFKLRGWKGKMYFGRYDSSSGKITAAYKDFYNNDKYDFLQSSTGEKIENPIDFTFYEDDVFVHSRTNEGVKLVYYDTATIVSTSEIQEATRSIEINPNPSTGIIRLNLDPKGTPVPMFTKYSICNSSGEIIGHGEINSLNMEVDLSKQPAGLYFLTLKHGQKVLCTKQFILIE